jgi:putative ABC transport system permease protein
MTTLAQDSALRGPANGGVAARRAVVRWAWRMFRREWRQQILVVALLGVAVAAAIVSITLVYNTSPVFDGEFGSARGLLRFEGSDPRALEAALVSAEESFGTTDVIGHRKVPSARRTRMGPTAAICSRSAVAATRPGGARSPSPRVLPSS